MQISEQVFPRLVCLLVTLSKDSKPNVMTASFLMPVSFKPKYVAVAISPSRSSFSNLRKTKEFSLNVCSARMETAAWICGTHSGRSVDKFKLANLTTEESKLIKPPLVRECPISFECRVEQMQKFGDHWLVVGKVVKERVRKTNFKPLMHKSGKEFFKF